MNLCIVSCLACITSTISTLPYNSTSPFPMVQDKVFLTDACHKMPLIAYKVLILYNSEAYMNEIH